MMGLRGCRLGIVHPEITEMQVGGGGGGHGGERGCRPGIVHPESTEMQVSGLGRMVLTVPPAAGSGTGLLPPGC